MKLLLLLPILLIGCTTPIKVKPEVIKLTPPPEFTQPTIQPVLIGNLNEDLVIWALELSASIERCNSDKININKWGTSK